MSLERIFYPDLDKSGVLIYESLNYRHWDTWEDGAFGHLFVSLRCGRKKNGSRKGYPEWRNLLIALKKPSGGR